MLAKFNETMEPLYMLLKEIEDIRLSSELLDPDIDSRIEQTNNVYDGTFATGKWADKRKGLNQMNPGLLGNHIQNFNVKIEDSLSPAQDQNQVKKEQPIWMVESTISGASSFDAFKNKVVNGNGPSPNQKPLIDTLELPSNGEFSSEQAKEVLELLLSFEKPNDPRWLKLARYFGFTIFDGEATVDTELDTTDATIQSIDLFDSTLIQVKNCHIPLSQISDEHILMMNEQEKQDYVRIAQQIYSNIFDI